MNRFKQIVMAFISLVFINGCYAIEKTSTLALTIINHSKVTLHFTGVSGQNPDNYFNINSHKIYPEATAVITCQTSANYDLAGIVHFIDEYGEESHLTIVDYRQFHVGQPIFALSNNKLNSSILSRTKADLIDPTALLYKAATIVVIDQSSVK